MFLDQNEIKIFQESPCNALCKNGILLKIPPLQNNFLGDFFDQTPQHCISIHSKVFIVAKIIRLGIKKSQRFYRDPEKIVIFKKNKNYKI